MVVTPETTSSDTDFTWSLTSTTRAQASATRPSSTSLSSPGSIPFPSHVRTQIFVSAGSPRRLPHCQRSADAHSRRIACGLAARGHADRELPRGLLRQLQREGAAAGLDV